MNIVFITFFFLDLWYLGYRECPYSGTVRIQLLSPIGKNVMNTIFIII